MILEKITSILIITNPVEKRDLFLTYILPLIGPSIVVFTFYKNYKKDRKNKRKEAKRAWYFKAYFEPSLKKLEAFFNESISIVEVGIENYNEEFPNNTIEDRVLSVAELLGQLAAKKRRFQIEVVETIRTAYLSEATKLELLLNDFEDAGANAFSDIEQEIPGDNFYKYLQDITELKANLINILSQPALLINKKKKADHILSVDNRHMV